MTSLLEYKGYIGSVDYNEEDEVFHGRLEFIRDLVTYEAIDAPGLKRAFHEAVDDYLEHCLELGRKAETPLKGSFNVRPGRELHRKAAVYARRKGISLNTVVSEALSRFLDDDRAA